jgi:acetate---CoA ligase (ADP-forming)
MDRLLRPKSVAVVGASPNPSFVSMILTNLLRHGYGGSVVAINPKYERILDAPCYASIAEVPHDVDLVVVGIGARQLPTLLEQCEAKQVGALEIVSSGFAETGAEGKRRQVALTNWAERTGIVVGGPNCLGLMHAPSGLHALPTNFERVVSGQVAVILQSGMMAPSVLTPLFARGIGVTFAVTSGNEADLEMADYIRYFVEDEQTRVIGCFAEQIKSPERFLEACEFAADHDKPIVMLKIGRSEAGRRAALAHTGSLVGANDVIDAVLRRCGVSRVASVDEMLEQLAIFHAPRLPRGSGVAAVIVSGGAAGLLSDLAPECGVQFPQLKAETARRLKTVVPEYGNVGNPLDITGQGVFETDILQRALHALAEADNLDVIIYGRAFPAYLDCQAPVARIIEEAIAEYPHKVCVAMSLVGGHFFGGPNPDVPVVEPTDRLGGIPFLQGSDTGLKAVAALIRYAAFQRERRLPLERRTQPAAVHLPHRPLNERESKAVLRHYGIPVTRERLACTLDEARAAAAEIGYPVALKLEAPGLVHKTEAGAVILDVRDSSALERAYTRLGGPSLVQEMAPPGWELLVGMTHDVQFGPVIAVGLGGVFVEVVRDVQLLLPPLTEAQALGALERLRGFEALKHGARGRPAADLDTLLEILVRFSELVEDLRETVQEIDINPLIVHASGALAVDALVVPK